jgi:hypothetical protein
VKLEDLEEAHPEAHPEAEVELWTEDEARLGLKPVMRRVWTASSNGAESYAKSQILRSKRSRII